MSSYLVPTDFTSAAFNALKLATDAAKRANAKVYLLHFCESKEELDEARAKLNDIFADETVEIEGVVRIGDFTEIGNVAVELETELIFMGSHGAKGMQKLLGSNALKTVSKSKTPYVLVQDGTFTDNLQSIVVPISLHIENLQKLQAVVNLAKNFNSTIHLIYSWPKETYQRNIVADNLRSAQEFLEKSQIDFTLYRSAGNFNEDTLRVAELKKSGLIAIMNMQQNSMFTSGLLGKNYEQELLENKLKVPVLIMNPVQQKA